MRTLAYLGCLHVLTASFIMNFRHRKLVSWGLAIWAYLGWRNARGSRSVILNSVVAGNIFLETQNNDMTMETVG